MAGAGIRWCDFDAAAPEIARAGQRLLEDRPGVPGAAFLGTVGSDGRPRMHPFVPAIVDGRLWAFVIDSPKRRDLDRDGGYAIHSVLGADDESFFVGGIAGRTDDPSHRTRGCRAHALLRHRRTPRALRVSDRSRALDHVAGTDRTGAPQVETHDSTACSTFTTLRPITPRS